VVHLRVISFSILFPPFPPPPLRHSPTVSSSLIQALRHSLDGTNYYPSQVHFFLFPRSRSPSHAFPRFTPKRPSCDKKLRELESATLRLAQLPATRVNLRSKVHVNCSSRRAILGEIAMHPVTIGAAIFSERR